MAVRGTFDLNDRPASEALRNIREEGLKTKEVMRDLGGAVDDVFTKQNREEADLYQGKLREVARTSATSLGEVRREWDKTDRQVIESVGKQEAALVSLETKLREVGAIDARPNVNLHGFTEAMAQADVLEARLRALGAANARPGVSVSAHRTPSFGGGGGGGGFGGRGLSIPFAGRIPWPLVGGALAAAPPLIGGATSLIGSAGSAALGAGALGISGFGAGAAAGAMTLPTTITTISQIKESSKALEDYREQVIETGPRSKEAREALRAFNASLAEAPEGTRRFLRVRSALGNEFRGMTRPGQADVTAIGTRGINLARELGPQAARLSNRFLDEGRQQADNFGDFLGGSRSRAFYESMAQEATSDLHILEGVGENVAATLMNISRAGRPFFHEGLEFVEDWTEGWRHGTNDISDTRREIGGMVDDLRSWGRLADAGFDLTTDLLGASRKPGTSMVDDLTGQLQEWDRWIERNPRQVREFFDDSVDGTKKIAGAIGEISGLLWRVSRQLTPLLEQGTDLLELLGNAGLLTPGGIPLLMGAGSGARSLFGRGAGAAAPGAPVGGAPLIVGGGGVRGAGAAVRGSFGNVVEAFRSPPLQAVYGRPGREYESYWMRRSRLGAGLSAARTEFGPAAGRFGGGFMRGFGPYAALSAGLGFLGTEGDVAERFQGGLSQATLGIIPAPPTADDKVREGFEAAMVKFKLGRGRTLTRGEFEDQAPDLASILGKYVPEEGGRRAPALNRAVAGLRETDTSTPGGAGEAQALRQLIGQIREQQSERAATAVGDIAGGFNVRRRHGVDERDAFGTAASSIERRASELHGRTAREFSQMGLDWAKGIAKGKPKLRGVADELAESIENRLNRMGENVEVIHGRIVDVSARSWGRVRKVIGSETQAALSEANDNLTALEKRAFAILADMGYSKVEARSLVNEAQHGRPTKAGAQAQAQAHHAGRPGKTVNNMAMGGRIATPRSGTMHDVVPLGGGNLAAGGELLIDGREVANRHTERKVDRMLAPYGTSLSREIGREGRAHSEPFREYNAALGGQLRGRTFATGGSISAAARLAQRLGLSVGEGPGFGGVPSGGHAAGSLHYSGLAYDISGDAGAMRRYRTMAERLFMGKGLNELFYDPYPYYIDAGKKVSGAIGGHSDHVHIGFFPGGARAGLRGFRGAGAATGAMGRVPSINLKAPGSRRGGAPGAAVNAQGQMAAAGMSRNLNRLMGAAPGGARQMRGLGGLQQLNHSFPEMHLGEKGPKLSGEEIMAINRWAGLPPLLFRQISTGESGDYPGMVGVDPGGTEGLGLYMITTGYNDELIARMGGRRAMLNPLKNAKAAKEIYRSQGVGAWYGTSHVTEKGWAQAKGRALGGSLSRPGFAGWFAKGGHFSVRNPTLVGVGDGGEEEDVSVTRARDRGRGGRAGGGGSSFAISVKTGPITVGNGADAKKVGHQIADGIAERLAEKMESSDSVPERALTG